MPVRSLVRQTLHYFSRPHEGLPRGPVDNLAAWHPDDLVETEWREALGPRQIEALEAALRHALATGKPRHALTRDDFPLGPLAFDLHRWRGEVAAGLGFAVITGLPVDRWTEAEAETVFWGLGLHLGICGAQNPQGDLLGHVRDQRAPVKDVTIRAYRTSANIAFHCDAADAVGLLCLKAAARGGQSRIASSISVYNALRESHPELVARLFEPMMFDTKAEGGLRFFPVPPCAYAEGDLRTFYHADYYREVERHADAPRLGARERALLDAYDETADRLSLEMDLRPGDIQLVSNHHILHARRGYEDAEDPAERRHLLRLWLSFPHDPTPRARWLRAKSRARLLASLAEQRWAQR